MFGTFLESMEPLDVAKWKPPGRRASGPERSPPGSFTRESEHSVSLASGSVVWIGCLRVLPWFCLAVILLVVEAGAQSTVLYCQVVGFLT